MPVVSGLWRGVVQGMVVRPRLNPGANQAGSHLLWLLQVVLLHLGLLWHRLVAIGLLVDIFPTGTGDISRDLIMALTHN